MPVSHLRTIRNIAENDFSAVLLVAYPWKSSLLEYEEYLMNCFPKYF